MNTHIAEPAERTVAVWFTDDNHAYLVYYRDDTCMSDKRRWFVPQQHGTSYKGKSWADLCDSAARMGLNGPYLLAPAEKEPANR